MRRRPEPLPLSGTSRDPAPLLLVELPVPPLSVAEATGNVPLGAGCLALYAQRAAALAHPVQVFDARRAARLGDAALTEALLAAAPWGVGFSLAVWNIEASLHIARALQAARPELRVFLGGPEVAADNALLAASGPETFDAAWPGEGEGWLAAVAAGADPAALPGTLLPAAGGLQPVAGASPTDFAAPVDLQAVFSPFVAGLVAPEPDGVMYLETVRGCRHRCSYCHYDGGRRRPAALPLDALVDAFAWAHDAGVREVYLLDPSLEQRPDLDEFLQMLRRVNRRPRLPLFAEVRADRVDRDAATAMARAGICAVEAGLQSVNPRALRAVNRPTRLAAFAAGCRALGAAGIRVKTDVMLGLPGDDAQGIRDTFRFLAAERLTDVQVFWTSVLPGTALRRHAERLGLVYDPQPPYAVQATPTLGRAEALQALEEGTAWVDVALSVDETPLFLSPGAPPAAGFEAFPLPAQLAPDVILQFAFDLDRPAGRRALERLSFSRVGRLLNLVFHARDPQRHARSLADATRRAVAAGPFGTLLVAVASDAEFPLDGLDAIEAALAANRPSRYVDEIHAGFAEWPHPERRLHVLWPATDVARLDESWAADARQLARLVFWARCTTPQDLAHALRGPVPLDDWLLLEPPPGSPAPIGARPRLFAQLYAAAGERERVALADCAWQWAWQRYVARRDADARGAPHGR